MKNLTLAALICLIHLIGFSQEKPSESKEKVKVLIYKKLNRSGGEAGNGGDGNGSLFSSIAHSLLEEMEELSNKCQQSLPVNIAHFRSTLHNSTNVLAEDDLQSIQSTQERKLIVLSKIYSLMSKNDLALNTYYAKSTLTILEDSTCIDSTKKRKINVLKSFSTYSIIKVKSARSIDLYKVNHHSSNPDYKKILSLPLTTSSISFNDTNLYTLEGGKVLHFIIKSDFSSVKFNKSLLNAASLNIKSIIAGPDNLILIPKDISYDKDKKLIKNSFIYHLGSKKYSLQKNL